MDTKILEAINLGVQDNNARKSKNVSLRMTENLYTSIKIIAEENKISLSQLIEIFIVEQLCALKQEYRKAQFINTCDKEISDRISEIEQQLPPACDYFSTAKKYFPDAKYDDIALNTEWLKTSKQQGFDTKELENAAESASNAFSQIIKKIIKDGE